jgi:hypothetical protein
MHSRVPVLIWVWMRTLDRRAALSPPMTKAAPDLFRKWLCSIIGTDPAPRVLRNWGYWEFAECAALSIPFSFCGDITIISYPNVVDKRTNLKIYWES